MAQKSNFFLLKSAEKHLVLLWIKGVTPGSKIEKKFSIFMEKIRFLTNFLIFSNLGFLMELNKHLLLDYIQRYRKCFGATAL